MSRHPFVPCTSKQATTNSQFGLQLVSATMQIDVLRTEAAAARDEAAAADTHAAEARAYMQAAEVG